MAANLLLSALLTGQALRVVARPPSQRGLGLMVGATGSLLLASRAPAVPGSPFLENIDALVMPVGTAWATWSARFPLPVPVLVVVLASRADAEAEVLSRRMAAQDAALAAEEAERRAANAVHDDVLSVLRAVSLAGGPVPWSVVAAKARGP